MRILVIFAFVTLFGVAKAEPSTLKLDAGIKKQSREKFIRAVHQEIATDTRNIDVIRYRILEGMLQTRGRAWTYEGEGEGYILARFDYREIITIMRIEYDSRLVQLKYHDANALTKCETLTNDGICYRNRRPYYNYTKNLRASITAQFQIGAEG